MRKRLFRFAPISIVLSGWLWQYIGYRVAFGRSTPEYGFYRRAGGHTLEWLLFAGPTLVVLLGLAATAIAAGRSLYRERGRMQIALYVGMCVVYAVVFAVPGIWFIDVPGRGDIFI